MSQAAGYNPTCLVRAYVTRNGKLEWESIGLPTTCVALATGAEGKSIIVTGLGTIGSGYPDDFLVQSYAADTGEFLWRSQTFVGTGFGNAAIAVDIEKRRAFVVGWVRWVPGRFSQEAFLVRAYDTRTGVLDWEDQYPSPQLCLCHAHDVVVHNGRVIVVGAGGTWLIRVYDAKHGDLLWFDDFAPIGGVGPIGGLTRGARAVAADGERVFVVGSGINASGNADFILRANDAK
jgi:outer membrane protein assembly factor BamB